MIYNRPFQNKSRRSTFLSGVVTGLAAAALSILLYTFIVRIDACLKTQFPTIEDTLLHNKFEQNILYGPYRETVETLSLSPTEEAVFWADKMHIVFTTLQRQWNGRWKVMEYQVTNFRMDSQYAYGQDPRRPYSPYDSSMTAYTKLLTDKEYRFTDGEKWCAVLWGDIRNRETARIQCDNLDFEIFINKEHGFWYASYSMPEDEWISPESFTGYDQEGNVLFTFPDEK